MKLTRTGALLAISFVAAVTMGRLDHESTSWLSVFALENWPAIVVFTAIIFGVLVSASRAVSGATGHRR